jgi:hypothetical protein
MLVLLKQLLHAISAASINLLPLSVRRLKFMHSHQISRGWPLRHLVGVALAGAARRLRRHHHCRVVQRLPLLQHLTCRLLLLLH